MNRSHRLWRWLAVVFFASFAALGYLGREIYLAAPPIPSTVQTDDGSTLFTGADIRSGQQAWLAAGGQQVGTVRGHGAYVAPDWSADWLHREAVALADILARRGYGVGYDRLAEGARAAIDAQVKAQMRRNTYDPGTGIVRVSADRAQAIATVARHFDALFGNDPALSKLREQYAMSDDALPDPAQREALCAFFFWSAWSTSTDRPGEAGLSYTSNWPYEPLVGNAMPTSAAM